jgi:hypothetical protein
LSFTTNERNYAEAWNTLTWQSYWPRCGTAPIPAANAPSATLCCEIGRVQRIVELCAQHQQAYRAGQHQLAISLVRELNTLRGLVTKRSVDRRDDVQRDHDEELQHGWSVGR